VDNLSSAHIYVRLREGETWENIDENLLVDCAQLTKANSIEGLSRPIYLTAVYMNFSPMMRTMILCFVKDSSDKSQETKRTTLQ